MIDVFKNTILSSFRRGVAFLEGRPELRERLKNVARRLGVFSSARAIYSRINLAGRKHHGNDALSANPKALSPQAKRMLKQLMANAAGKR